MKASDFKASEFLQMHLDFVSKLEEQKPGSVDMITFVSKWDEENKCGTVCCMEGWLPSFFEEFTWEEEVVYKNGKYFETPHEKITKEVWFYLTGIGGQLNVDGFYFPYLSTGSSFRVVKEAWETAIEYLKSKGQ